MIKKPACDDPRASTVGDSASGGAAGTALQLLIKKDLLELSSGGGLVPVGPLAALAACSGFSEWDTQEDCGGPETSLCSNPSRRSNSSTEAI